MPQNTAPESYYSDQTEVRPKSRDGKYNQQTPFTNPPCHEMFFHIKVSHYKSNKKLLLHLTLLFFQLVKRESKKDNYFDIITAAFY